MRLKSQQQQQWWWSWRQCSTNQRLRAHGTISVIIIPVAVVVLLRFCLLATTAVAAAAISSSHPDAIQIGDPKQRIIRQVAKDDKAVDDACDCDPLDGLYHKPHFAKGRSVIVELFEWKFVDVAEECQRFLGPMGYGGVQISPVLEHTIIKTSHLKHPWWQRFETVSYRFASRSGDESDFWSMTRICNDNGVRIYLDVLLNHMAAPLNHIVVASKEISNFTVNTLLESNVNISNMSYSNVPYAAKHFHRPCAVGDSPATHDIRNCQLNGHPDLDMENPQVEQHIVEMLNRFIDMGVAGFHLYSAKYVWPNNLKKIYEKLKNLSKDFGFEENARPLMYHDIFDMGLDSISKTEYATYGAVTEYLYPIELSAILRGKAPLSSLINWGPAMGFLAQQDSVVFVDNPQTQRGLPEELGNNRVLTFRNRQKYIMANAFMMTHPYGRLKRIMSSYYFKEKNIDQGPPAEEEDEDTIRSPEFDDNDQCSVDSGWVCEHRWPETVNLVALANYFSVPEHQEESVVHFQTNGPNHIAFCRGQTAFVAMNNDPDKDYIKDVFTCLEPGIYCDVISGGLKEDSAGCHGHSLKVNETGYAKLQLLVADNPAEDEEGNVVENLGVLIVYVASKIGSNEEKVWDVENIGDPDDNKGNAAEDNASEDNAAVEADDGMAEGIPKVNDEEDGSAKDAENIAKSGELEDDHLEGREEHNNEEAFQEEDVTSNPAEQEEPENVENIDVKEEEVLEGEAKENDGADNAASEDQDIKGDDKKEKVEPEAENNSKVIEDEVEEVTNSNAVDEKVANEGDSETPGEVEDMLNDGAVPDEEEIVEMMHASGAETEKDGDNGAESAKEEDKGEDVESIDNAEETNVEGPKVDDPPEVPNIEADEKNETGENAEGPLNEEETTTSEVPSIEADEKKESREDLGDPTNEEADEQKHIEEDLADQTNKVESDTNADEILQDPIIEVEDKKETIEEAESSTIEEPSGEGYVIEPPEINEVGSEISKDGEQIGSVNSDNENEEKGNLPDEDGNKKDGTNHDIDTFTFSTLDEVSNIPDTVENYVTDAMDVEETKNPDVMEPENGPTDNPKEDVTMETPRNDKGENDAREVDDLNTEKEAGKEEVDSSVPNEDGKNTISKVPADTRAPHIEVERPVVVNVQQSVHISPGNVNAYQQPLDNTENSYKAITTEEGNEANNVTPQRPMSGAMFPAFRQQLQGNGQMKRCYPHLHGLILLEIFVIGFYFKHNI